MEQRTKKLVVGITIPASVGLLRGQMKHFVELGYDACLLTQHDEESLNYCEREGCRPLNVMIERNMSPFKDLITLFSLIRLFRKERPDVVNLGTPKMSLLGLMAAWWCRVPNRIYTCRGFRYEHEHGLIRKILKTCEKICGRCAQKIICISPSVKALGLKDHLFKESKCVVINKGSSNGIDPTFYNRSKVNEEDRQKLIEELGFKDKFVYGFLGRIVDRKGLSELFEAFKRIYEEDKNCRLLIVGPAYDEQVSDKTLIPRMKEHEAVVLAGKQLNAPLYFSLMDAFVLPAWWEGFGNVLVQAADMEIPVISTTGTGTCDAVCDGFNGILIEPKNIDALYEVMKKIKEDKDLRDKLAKNGPIWGQNFKSEIIWEGMDKLYKA